MIRAHVALARELAARIGAHDDFELMAPVPFGLVLLPSSALQAYPRKTSMGFNRRLLERVNATRRFHLTHTRLDGRYVVRIVVGQRTTARERIDAVWSEIQRAAAEKDREGAPISPGAAIPSYTAASRRI